MVLDSTAADILYTPKVSGVNANFLRPSIVAAGLDPEALEAPEGGLDMKGEAKVWRDIWSAGHGVGTIDDIPPVRDLCLRLRDEYDAALRRAAAEAAARGLLTEAWRWPVESHPQRRARRPRHPRRPRGARARARIRPVAHRGARGGRELPRPADHRGPLPDPRTSLRPLR
jgi:hypothetical protein